MKKILWWLLLPVMAVVFIAASIALLVLNLVSGAYELLEEQIIGPALRGVDSFVDFWRSLRD